MKIKYRIYLVTIDEWHQFFRFRILEINDEKVSFNCDLDKKYPYTDFQININADTMKMHGYLRVAVDIGWQIIEHIYKFMHDDCAFYTLSYAVKIMDKFTPNYLHLE